MIMSLPFRSMSFTNYLLSAVVVLLAAILVVLVDIAAQLRNGNQQDALGEVLGFVRDLVCNVLAAIFQKCPGL